MIVRYAAALALTGSFLATATLAWADPGPDPVTDAIAPVNAAEPPVDDGKVESTPPVTTTSPDGWTLTVSAEDETQMPAAPLATAISTREYIVGGTFNGSLEGAGDSPSGTFEVGYQIGCGIDMSASPGAVTLTGTAGSSIGDFFGAPAVGGNLNGSVAVALKPGIINYVAVTKKQFKGAEPWVSVSNFRVKIDGCVGESFIRSYATLTKSNDLGDAILSWYGVTKAV